MAAPAAAPLKCDARNVNTPHTCQHPRHGHTGRHYAYYVSRAAGQAGLCYVALWRDHFGPITTRKAPPMS